MDEVRIYNAALSAAQVLELHDGPTAGADSADLSIDKTANATDIFSGQQLVYTIDVTNNGPDDAVNVEVTDTLPAGATYDLDSDSCVEAPVGTLTCDLGNIASGGVVSFDITVDVELVASGVINNTASVTSDTDDPELADNTDDVDTNVTVIEIDIGAGGAPDVNICSNGVLPVAILGSADFDATTVDPESVRLGDAGVRMAGKSGKLLCNDADVNEDGFIDLVCKILIADLGIVGSGPVEVDLFFTPFGGEEIVISGVVNVIKDDCN